jgi:hypothetical protein
MSRPRVSPAILADRGVPVTLVDGNTYTLLYNFRSLMHLEQKFGSVQAAIAIVSNTQGAAFTSLAGILAAGLLHEVTPPEDDGRPLGEVEVLADFLDPKRIGEYADLMGQAFKLSFPEAPAADGDAADPTVPTTDSPGPSGTTPPVSASAFPSPSSGL